MNSFTLKPNISRNINVFLLGTSFFLIFVAFNTMGNVQTVILDNAKDPESTGFVAGFEGEGFYSLAIIYAFSAILNRLAPPIITYIGLKWTMVKKLSKLQSYKIKCI